MSDGMVERSDRRVDENLQGTDGTEDLLRVGHRGCVRGDAQIGFAGLTR